MRRFGALVSVLVVLIVLTAPVRSQNAAGTWMQKASLGEPRTEAAVVPFNG